MLSLITFKPIDDLKQANFGLGVVLSLITFKQYETIVIDTGGFGSSAIFNYF